MPKNDDLEKKLVTLLHEIETAGIYGDVHDETYRVVARKIHQAFRDDGYVKASRHERVNQRLREKVVSGEVMSGREWFDRFLKEYRKLRRPDDTGLDIAAHCATAVRRAAGIFDEDQLTTMEVTMLKLDLSDDKLIDEVQVVWSTKYAIPLYKVNGKTYAPSSGEYAGYFEEVKDL